MRKRRRPIPGAGSFSHRKPSAPSYNPSMLATPIDGPRSVPGILAKLLRREDLGREEADFVAGQLLSEQANPAQAAALLVALHSKGESAQEIAALARASHRPLSLPQSAPKPPVA